MKIAFMGSDPIALPMLDAIQSDASSEGKIVAVFTQPDRKTGRGMRLQANAVKRWATAHGIEVMQPRKCGHAEADLIKERGIDLLLVMAYGQILPRCMLTATPNKVLNVHASLLPRLRGASPIHTAVATGSTHTGVSLMEIIPEMDAGPVANQEVVGIDPHATTAEVIDLLAAATIPLVHRGLNDLANGRLVFTEQDPQAVTYCRIIEKTDNHLDFKSPASDLYNRIRAFQPWPGTAFVCRDLEIRILQAEVLTADPQGCPPGMVVTEGNAIKIACGQDFLVPKILQRPGGKAMPVEDFLRGFHVEAGTMLPCREMRALEKKTPFPWKKK